MRKCHLPLSALFIMSSLQPGAITEEKKVGISGFLSFVHSEKQNFENSRFMDGDDPCFYEFLNSLSCITQKQ